jgi:ketosteroid isomerase-like protein
MKYGYAAMVASCALLSSGSVSAQGLEEFAQRFVLAEDKAWQTGDVDDLERLEDPNVVYYTSRGEVLTAGFAAHKEYILSNRESLTDLQQDWEYLAGGGSIFSMSYRSIAETPTQEIEVDALFVFRLENGRIIEVWTNGTTAVRERD